MLSFIGVFLGGGLGSILRFAVCSKISNHWGVMLVNIIGALLIGFLYQFFIDKSDLRPEVRAFIITGLLGGFTTFSTYMLDFGNLLNTQKTAEAFLYLLGSLIVGIAFLYLGMRLGRFFNV